MSLSRCRALASLVCIVLLLASCSLEQQYNPYQSAAVQDQAGQGAIAELQRDALNALSRQDYQQAIDLLQRALRIEPRDPLSWHFLARSYWRSGDLKRCVEMVERSYSYSSSEDNLDHANETLKARCQQI